jgi:cell division protein FtsZ
MHEPAQHYQPHAPAQPAPAPERKRSLFERMTGAGRRAEPAPHAPEPAPRRAEPTLGNPAPRAYQQDAASQAAREPRLGIEPPVRHRATSIDPKEIEIPAFLRRQAN